MPLRDSRFRRRCSSVHMSSFVSWLKEAPLPSPSVPSLSHPNNVDDVVQCNVPAEAIASFKKEIAVLSRKRKRGNYGHYDEVTRPKFVKYANSNGGMNAVRKFSKELEKPLNESTARGIKNRIWRVPDTGRKMSTNCTRTSSVAWQRTWHQSSIVGASNSSKKGGVVNSSVVITIARGVILYENRSLLQEYGGHITFFMDWVKSVLNRMGYVKTKGTKAVKKVVDNFPEIKATFLQRITDSVKEHSIPPELVINWDQTGVSICLTPLLLF